MFTGILDLPQTGILPLSEFEKIPFNSFLIPGIILFSILGLIPLLLIRAFLKKTESKLAEYFNVFKDMHWSWTFSIYRPFFNFDFSRRRSVN